MRKKIGLFAAGVLALAMVARAGIIVYNASLVSQSALAYNNTYSLDLQSNGINSLSAQAVYSSATVPSVSFYDGSQSTGSFTVSSFSQLAAAKASNHVTVTNNAGTFGASLILPGFVLQNGIDWATRDTSSGTAASLASALSAVSYLSVSRVGSVVYATTTVTGANYNSLNLVSSTPTALTVATPFFTGGLDDARVRINGLMLTQGQQWTASVSSATTATSLASAVNTALGSVLQATANSPSSGIVALKSKLNGALYNYSLVSSIPSALAVSGANMTGGNTPADVLGSAVLSIPSHGMSLALPVLYSGSPVIGGLSSQTTYYVIPVTANSLELASSKSNALLGIGITVVSTNTQTSKNTYSLTPLSITGNPSFKWQVSNDGSNWNDLAVSSVTVSSYSNPAATTIWSFGYIGTRYLRLSVVAPTTGGLSLNVGVIGTN